MYSIEDSRSTQFVQMMTVSGLLTFLRQGQICAPMHLYWENVEKSFSQNVLKTNGWNLQCVIKVVKHFSYNQNFVPWGLFALATGLYTCTKLCNFLNVFVSESAWAIFTRFHVGLLSKGYCQFVQMVPRNWRRWPPCPYMVQALEKLLLQNKTAFGLNLGI